MNEAVIERKLLSDGMPRELPWSRVEWRDEDNDDEMLSASDDVVGDSLIEKISRRVDNKARPAYPKPLLVVFVISSVVTMVAIAGLLLSPLYASPDVVTLLFAAAGIGMGVLAVVTRRAEGLRQS